MSRSFKKTPVEKYGVTVTKPQASRKLRRINKMRLNVEDEPLLPHEVVNQYDIKDWRWNNFNGDEEYEYIKRK